jgi:hypothetical protein
MKGSNTPPDKYRNSILLAGPNYHSEEKNTTQPKKVLLLNMKLWKMVLFAQIRLKN